MPHLRAVPLILTVIAIGVSCSASSGPQAIVLPSGTGQTGWQTYTDAKYRFAVSYPDDLDVVPETASPTRGIVKLLRLQDKHILSGQFAQLEQPRFTVEVFAAGSGTSLTDLLRSVNRLPAGAMVTPVTLAGAGEGVRVRTPQLLEPNEFYYFQTSEYVYGLTPLGSGSDLLASFRLF